MRGVIWTGGGESKIRNEEIGEEITRGASWPCAGGKPKGAGGSAIGIIHRQAINGGSSDGGSAGNGGEIVLPEEVIAPALLTRVEK
jgi:hypothetical protein